MAGQDSTKSEFVAGIGPSQFFGDLGGSPSFGTHFLKDFNFGAIRYAMELGYRYNISKYFAAKAMLTGGLLYGSDALSTNSVRNNRNLSFRSPLVELSGQFEYYFYRASKYKIRYAKGLHLNIDGYLFAGVGGFYFNPAGKYTNGKWYDLRPLSTEGEGLPGGPPEYSLFAFSVPIGIGGKYVINRQWAVGLEISHRVWTSTDYIDDVHGNYYNNATILADKGPVAAYFADPSLNHDSDASSAPGTERGDPRHNDNYMFMFITVSFRPNFLKGTPHTFL
jgi:hypothetical protein